MAADKIPVRVVLTYSDSRLVPDVVFSKELEPEQLDRFMAKLGEAFASVAEPAS